MGLDNTIRYRAEHPPTNADDLPEYLARELRRISLTLESLASGFLPKTHVEPAKPRNGMLRYADGTDWDPGSGEGAYLYTTSWIKL